MRSILAGQPEYLLLLGEPASLSGFGPGDDDIVWPRSIQHGIGAGEQLGGLLLLLGASRVRQQAPFLNQHNDRVHEVLLWDSAVLLRQLLSELFHRRHAVLRDSVLDPLFDADRVDFVRFRPATLVCPLGRDQHEVWPGQIEVVGNVAGVAAVALLRPGVLVTPHAKEAPGAFRHSGAHDRLEDRRCLAHRPVTQAIKILAQLRQGHRVTLGKKELTEAHEVRLAGMLCRDQLTGFQEILANQLNSRLAALTSRGLDLRAADVARRRGKP